MVSYGTDWAIRDLVSKERLWSTYKKRGSLCSGGSAVIQMTKEKGNLSFLRVLAMEETKEIKSCAYSRID